MADSETPPPKEPTPPSPTIDDPQIALQVGERRFLTTRSTLTHESAFFSSLLSDRWSHTAQADGSYFIDADPDIFVHILRYLRRGVYPLLYDNRHGHDHALYLQLRADAAYFQIARLETWIRDRGYLGAVSLEYSVRAVEGVVEVAETIGGGVDEVRHFVHRGTRKVYICPRGLRAHRGNQQFCGKQCRRAQGDEEDEFEDEDFWTTMVVGKKTVVDQSVCIRH